MSLNCVTTQLYVATNTHEYYFHSRNLLMASVTYAFGLWAS